MTPAGLGRCFGGAVVVALVAASACNPPNRAGLRRQKLFATVSQGRAFLTLRWHKQLREHKIFTFRPEEFAGAGASHDGRRIYVGTGGGVVHAFLASSGREVWRRRIGAPVTSPPLIVERLKMLFVGAGDGAVHALDLETGAKRWRYKTKGVTYRAPVYSDGVVYFANQRDQVFSLAARSGRWRWSYDRERPEGFTVAGHGRPLVVGDRVYAGFSDGSLVCLSARSGDTLWTRRLTSDAKSKKYVDVDADPIIDGKRLYVSSFSGGLHALTADGGALLWRFPVEGASTVAVTDDRIYLASSRLGLFAVDLDGRLRWRQTVEKAGTPSGPFIHGAALYYTFADGGLFVVDRRTGQMMQRFNPGDGISGPPLLTEDSLYVLSNRGGFYAFTLR